MPQRIAVLIGTALATTLVACGGSEDPGGAPADDGSPDHSPIAEQPEPAEFPNCPIGDKRAISRSRGKRSVLLGCARLDAGRLVGLFATGGGEGGSGGPCLEITGVDDEAARSCGRAPSERVPAVTEAVAAEATVKRHPSAPLEIYGVISADVANVALEYGDETTMAEVIHVSDQEVLADAGISEPFGYFVAELPSSTPPQQVAARGSDYEGNELGSDTFERISHGRMFIGGPFDLDPDEIP